MDLERQATDQIYPRQYLADGNNLINLKENSIHQSIIEISSGHQLKSKEVMKTKVSGENRRYLFRLYLDVLFDYIPMAQKVGLPPQPSLKLLFSVQCQSF